MYLDSSDITDDTPYPVKAYSLKELAVMYKVHHKIIANWLKPFEDKIGRKVGHYYTVLQVEIIFSLLGPPHVEAEEK